MMFTLTVARIAGNLFIRIQERTHTAGEEWKENEERNKTEGVEGMDTMIVRWKQMLNQIMYARAQLIDL